MTIDEYLAYVRTLSADRKASTIENILSSQNSGAIEKLGGLLDEYLSWAESLEARKVRAIEQILSSQRLSVINKLDYKRHLVWYIQHSPEDIESNLNKVFRSPLSKEAKDFIVHYFANQEGQTVFRAMRKLSEISGVIAEIDKKVSFVEEALSSQYFTEIESYLLDWYLNWIASSNIKKVSAIENILSSQNSGVIEKVDDLLDWYLSYAQSLSEDGKARAIENILFSRNFSAIGKLGNLLDWYLNWIASSDIKKVNAIEQILSSQRLSVINKLDYKRHLVWYIQHSPEGIEESLKEVFESPLTMEAKESIVRYFANPEGQTVFRVMKALPEMEEMIAKIDKKVSSVEKALSSRDSTKIGTLGGLLDWYLNWIASSDIKKVSAIENILSSRNSGAIEKLGSLLDWYLNYVRNFSAKVQAEAVEAILCSRNSFAIEKLGGLLDWYLSYTQSLSEDGKARAIENILSSQNSGAIEKLGGLLDEYLIWAESLEARKVRAIEQILSSQRLSVINKLDYKRHLVWYIQHSPEGIGKSLKKVFGSPLTMEAKESIVRYFANPEGQTIFKVMKALPGIKEVIAEMDNKISSVEKALSSRDFTKIGILGDLLDWYLNLNWIVSSDIKKISAIVNILSSRNSDVIEKLGSLLDWYLSYAQNLSEDRKARAIENILSSRNSGAIEKLGGLLDEYLSWAESLEASKVRVIKQILSSQCPRAIVKLDYKRHLVWYIQHSPEGIEESLKEVFESPLTMEAKESIVRYFANPEGQTVFRVMKALPEMEEMIAKIDKKVSSVEKALSSQNSTKIETLGGLLDWYLNWIASSDIKKVSAIENILSSRNSGAIEKLGDLLDWYLNYVQNLPTEVQAGAVEVILYSLNSSAIKKLGDLLDEYLDYARGLSEDGKASAIENILSSQCSWAIAKLDFDNHLIWYIKHFPEGIEKNLKKVFRSKLNIEAKKSVIDHFFQQDDPTVFGAINRVAKNIRICWLQRMVSNLQNSMMQNALQIDSDLAISGSMDSWSFLGEVAVPSMPTVGDDETHIRIPTPASDRSVAASSLCAEEITQGMQRKRPAEAMVGDGGDEGSEPPEKIRRRADSAEEVSNTDASISGGVFTSAISRTFFGSADLGPVDSLFDDAQYNDLGYGVN